MEISNRTAIVVFSLLLIFVVGVNANEKPIAVVGQDIVVETWMGASAIVTLDAGGSYDPDGDDLTYLWTWTVDSNTYDANTASLELSLPFGSYDISLVVNDGIEDSEPNYVNVTVNWIGGYLFVSAADGNDQNTGGFYCNYGGNGPKATIQSAVDIAKDGKKILILDGVYTGPGNRDINVYDKKITIISENGPNNCIIDCNGLESEYHNAFNFGQGADNNSILDGITIINGYAASGGAVNCEDGGAPVIKNCVIQKCRATNDGGAIANCGGKVLDCKAQYNFAYGSGGAFYNCDYIQGCDVYNNSAHFGGGFGGCDGEIVDCNVTFNNALGDGGGLCDCNANVVGLKVCNNTARWSGGFYACNGDITRCIITDNSANSGSGAMYWCRGKIKNCVIFNNQTAYVDESIGGLAYCDGEIQNCIIWANSGVQISDCTNVKYCCVQDCNDSNNIKIDPGFIDSSNGDFHLKSRAGRWDPDLECWVKDWFTSPCIDAGNPRDSYDYEIWPHGKRINMGIYGGTVEASLSKSDTGIAADYNLDYCVNFIDYAILVNHFTTSCGLEDRKIDLNYDCKVDCNDIEVMANCWLAEEDPNYALTIIQDFESGVFAEDFNSYGDANWVVVAGGANDSNFAAQTLPIEDNQKCVLKYVFDLDEDRNKISFNYKVSTEQYSDNFSFYIDGKLTGQWSGEIDWSLATFDITAGPHVFKWVYEKDWNCCNGQDSVWIDDIKIYYEP